jgi:hypothetical protein
MNLDYKIAEDYLNKLPEADKLKLINRTLGEVTENKPNKSQLRKYYSGFLKNKIKAGKI